MGFSAAIDSRCLRLAISSRLSPASSAGWVACNSLMALANTKASSDVSWHDQLVTKAAGA